MKLADQKIITLMGGHEENGRLHGRELDVPVDAAPAPGKYAAREPI